MNRAADTETGFSIDGSGPPVVLVHGMGLNRAMWQGMLPPLAARFTVIRYDLLGHGESAAPPLPCTLGDLVAQLDALLSRLEISRTAIVGFSLGGTLAQAFAVDHPDRTVAIAVLNSAYRRDAAQRDAMLERLRLSEDAGPAATVDAALERWFTPGFAAARPDMLDQVRQWMVANDPAHYAALYRVLVTGDAAAVADGRPLADAIADIACPALVLTGDDDRNSTPAMARGMAARMSAGRVETFPGLRHMGLAEDPDRFNGALVPFLARAFASPQ